MMARINTAKYDNTKVSESICHTFNVSSLSRSRVRNSSCLPDNLFNFRANNNLALKGVVCQFLVELFTEEFNIPAQELELFADDKRIDLICEH